MTPTAVGWVLAEGHSADGAILDHAELALRPGRGVRAVSIAEQVKAEVLRVEAMAAATDRRLRVIGVTWSDDASAAAALLLEALTDAGFDNLVPVRMLEAVETLARALAPVVGYEQTAVCILEPECATVVMVDTQDGETQTVAKQVRGGFDALMRWLTGMFERDGWRPGGVVVAGADDDLNGFSWQLEKALPVPVFAQTMVHVTVARGTALTAARSTEFTDEQLVPHTAEPAVVPPRRGQLSYAGALTALAAGAITFVTSLSVAVGIRLAPESGPATTKHVMHASTPQIAQAVAPAIAPPPDAASPTPAPKAPADDPPVARPGAPEQQPADGAERQPAPESWQPYLTRMLEHIPGDAGDPEQQPPDQP